METNYPIFKLPYQIHLSRLASLSLLQHQITTSICKLADKTATNFNYMTSTKTKVFGHTIIFNSKK